MRSRDFTIRQKLYNAQKGLCWYCGRPMREPTIEPIKKYLTRIGVTQMTRKQIRNVRCTIEHMERLADGGTSRQDNLVAACSECNSMRQDTPVDEWKAHRQCA